jgi:dihydroneopterin aldolase
MAKSVPAPSFPNPPTASGVRVSLRDVTVDVSVGLHPWERFPERPTRLIVNIDLFAPLTVLHADGGDILDYDRLRAHLKTWPGRPHVETLETLVEELVTLCFTYPAADACRVSIMKPDIFNEIDGVGVEYSVRRSDWDDLKGRAR